MSKIRNLVQKAAGNGVLQYIFSRYATYFVQFINSLFIAVFLGPYYLGIWGFISLIIQYLTQLNLGIPHSVNALVSVHKNKEWYVEKIIGASLTMLFGLSILIILFFGANEVFNFDIGGKYNFSLYVPLVIVIGIFGHFNSLFSNIFRIYGRITEIAINQSILPFLMLIAIFIFRGNDLLWALVCANLFAFAFSMGMYLIKMPVDLKPIFATRLIKIIQIKGWHLFVYNTSFYLIIISTKSFISAYYTVEEFGYFTFAFSLAHAVLMLLESFSFLVYPKLLNRLAFSTAEKITSLLKIIRDVYITTSHLLIHLAIFVFPIFLMFFPQYELTSKSFKLIALTVVLYTNSFGYTGLLIAKGEEKKLGYVSLFALGINTLSALFVIKILHVPFSSAIIATTATYMIYIYILGYLGRKTIGSDTSVRMVLKDIYPMRLIIPFSLSLSFIIFSFPAFLLVVPLALFLVLNCKVLKNLRQITLSIVNNSKVFNI
ncbi:MAG: hypothetical protein AAGU19_17290 [Prolixibacteraceae bacterium]